MPTATSASSAVRFSAPRLPQRGRAHRIDGHGSKLRNADLTEKMTFSRRSGHRGAKGIPALEKMLAAKGLLGRKEDPETRACAAMALAKSARGGSGGARAGGPG